jgi:hypothetical protein
MEASPSPLSSRPKRSVAEGSAVQRTFRGNVFRRILRNLTREGGTRGTNKSALNEATPCECLHPRPANLFLKSVLIHARPAWKRGNQIPRP